MATTDRGRVIASYRSRMEEIHGGLHRTDAFVFEILDAIQKRRSIVGDILEIGTYQGRSAILLGYLLGTNERLHVCDRFTPPTVDDPDFLEGTIDYYQPYPQSTFEQHYLRFHDELPVLHVCSSLDLPGRVEGGSFRFIHLDGSHRRDVLRSDIELAKKLLVEGGVIAFSSYRVMATLEVSAAVWAEVASGELTPVCATDWELFVTTSPQPSFSDDIAGKVKRIPSLKLRTPPFGDARVPIVGQRRDRRMSDPRSYVPPILVPTMANLKRRMAGFSHRFRQRA